MGTRLRRAAGVVDRGRSGRALRTCGALRTRGSRGTLRADVALGTLRAGVSLRTLRPDLAVADAEDAGGSGDVYAVGAVVTYDDLDRRDARGAVGTVGTGRSRIALFASRVPAGLAFLLPFVAAGYALAAVATVVFAGSNPVPGVHLLVTTGLWVLVEVAFYYLLAVGLVCLIGSRSYAIGILLAWRLALTPILATISALGIVRELVPGVALQALTPVGVGNAARQGAAVPMSTLAVAGVLVAWVVALLAAGAVRDVTRDA